MSEPVTDRKRFFELLKRAGDPLVKAKKKKGGGRKTERGYSGTETPRDTKEDTSD